MHGFKLARRREQTCAVRLDAALLTHDAELYREPVDAGEPLQLFRGTRTAHRTADETVQLGQTLARQRDRVPDYLVDNVGLGRVERRRVGGYVLRREEDAARERL